jgi:hypothetical protein
MANCESVDDVLADDEYYYPQDIVEITLSSGVTSSM